MLVAIVALAAAVVPQAAAASKHAKPKSGSHHAAPSFYVLANARKKCRGNYTKQTVTIRVRKHHRWVPSHQTRCVYTGSVGSLGSVPTFPSNLPTAGISVSVIPTATADSYTTQAGQTLDVSATDGVLANDLGIGLGATVGTGPAHGNLTLNHGGAFHYVPDSGYSGIDHFTYRAVDSSGESSAPATVTLHVTPLAAAVGGYSVGAAGTLDVGAPGLLAGAVGSDLHAALVATPAGGQLTLNADGSFTYTAGASFAGVDSFSFDVVDGAGQASNVITVTIAVGAGPPTLVPQTISGEVANTELQVGGTRGSGAGGLPRRREPAGRRQRPQRRRPEHDRRDHHHRPGRDGHARRRRDVHLPAAAPASRGPSDSFNYQVDTREGISAQASATIDFSGARVWYVNAAAGPGGDGSSAAPFNSLSPVSSGGVATSGDAIVLFAGSYTGGVTLGAERDARRSVGRPRVRLGPDRAGIGLQPADRQLGRRRRDARGRR